MSIRQSDRMLSQKLRDIIDGAERQAEAAYGGRVGLVMVFVPFNVGDSEMQYIANVPRSDGVDMLRKLFARWHIPIEDVPAHDKQ
jgi:hypothetical protein